MSPAPAAPVRQALRRLERRMLGLLLLYGIGKLAVTGTGLLLALYLLDRLFVPPPGVRFVLLGLALAVFAVRVAKRLVHPLRRRPSGRDLAALWERSHPALGGLLATAVELPEAPTGTSADLLRESHARAAAAVDALDVAAAAPSGRARRSGFRGLGVLFLAAALAWGFPAESTTFLKRLAGGRQPWPSDTTLVLLPPFLEGAPAPELRETGPERYRLDLANGSVASVRVRAEGEVPERVVALVRAEERAMRPLGGGEFVLRLPPLQGSLELRFRGGDDADGLPLLRLEGGDAPGLRDWAVAVEPPAYTGVAPSESGLSEFRVPAGTALRARFRAEPTAAAVSLTRLDGSETPLTPEADGSWSFTVTAESSGEVAVSATGEDGFRSERAGVLRWQAVADRAPRVAFTWPEESWATLPGGVVPVALEASDDYGLAELGLREGEEGAERLLALDSPRRSARFEALPAPPLPAEVIEGGSTRLRYHLRALDGAPPAGQESRATSPWIEVLGQEAFEERHAQRMIRAREGVERLIERAEAFVAGRAASPRQDARRVARELEGLQLQLERTLLERLYAGGDPAATAARPALDELIASGAPGPGAVAGVLDAAGVAPLERAGLLLDLARAARAARGGPAEALTRAAETGGELAAPAAELRAQLEAMLDILLAWEDFQSAVDLLRGLLDRQRTLYLRTKEASTR